MLLLVVEFEGKEKVEREIDNQAPIVTKKEMFRFVYALIRRYNCCVAVRSKGKWKDEERKQYDEKKMILKLNSMIDNKK